MTDDELIEVLEKRRDSGDLERAAFLRYLGTRPIILSNKPRFSFRTQQEED